MTTYKRAGVDIAKADALKRRMARSLRTSDRRVLNRLGAFASLIDGTFPGYQHPVLVLKTEEPGSKQQLAFARGRVASICADMVNHLINDIAVMGADPVAVQDCIVCGKLEKSVVLTMVKALAAACRAQGCVLTGGETSEQPGVIPVGTYVLTSSIVGVVEKSRIMDGKRIRAGDIVLAVASNGLHTNGFSLVRKLLERKPSLLRKRIGHRSFLDVILTPHTCYYKALRGLFGHPGLHGLAHITGGGIAGNLNRILPKGTAARIDLRKIRVLPVFAVIQKEGEVPAVDMLRTFNMGVGLAVVVAPEATVKILSHFKQYGCTAYPIGRIIRGNQDVRFEGMLTR